MKMAWKLWKNVIGAGIVIRLSISMAIVSAGPGKEPLEFPVNNHWVDHKNPISLKYSDDHVAIYFDSQVSETINWPFAILSKVWKYVRKHYGDFWKGHPRLFVILHAKHYPCISIGLYYSRNIIDCGHPIANGWTNYSPSNVERLITPLAEIIQEGTNGMMNTMDLSVSGLEMCDIIAYDIYLYLKDSKDKEKVKDKAKEIDLKVSLMKWKKEKEQKIGHGSKEWFRFWFLPIYDKYGGIAALKKFYTLVNSHWPKREFPRFYEQMNSGEFIHFWSGSAGTNLVELAGMKTNGLFNWTEAIQEEFNEAKNKYSQFKYSGGSKDSGMIIRKENQSQSSSLSSNVVSIENRRKTKKTDN